MIATSPLVRCVETAELLAAGVPDKAEVVELDELRPGGDVDGLLRWTARQARKHQADRLGGPCPRREPAGRRADRRGGRPDPFCEGGRRRHRFRRPPALGGGELRWLVTAKVLGC